MPIASLSTMWMQGRFQRLVDFMRAASEAGFDRFELSHIVTAEMLAGLRPDDYTITSLHDPCPNSRAGRGGIQLAARDAEARRIALDMAKATIDAAGRYAAPAVILHVGWVEMDVSLLEGLRQLYDAGKRESGAYRALQEKAALARVLGREPHFAAALTSLGQLRDYARERGIKLGLENRVGYHEIPSLEEMKDLLHTFNDGTVYYWHDSGHAQVLQALGFAPHEAWLKACGKRLLGLHLHDVQGIHDHRIPGVGDVDFTLLRPYLTPDVIAVCEFDRVHSLAEIRAGREYLESLDKKSGPADLIRSALLSRPQNDRKK